MAATMDISINQIPQMIPDVKCYQQDSIPSELVATLVMKCSIWTSAIT